AKQFEMYARCCQKLAEEAGTPDLRDRLLQMAQEFMWATKRTDLLPDFRTIDKLRDWLPIRREQCGKDDFRKSKWWRSSGRRIAIRWRRWPSGTASASRRSTPGASASVVCRRAMSSGCGSSRWRMGG